MKKHKKIWSMLLTTALCLSLLPMTTFAAEPTTHTAPIDFTTKETSESGDGYSWVVDGENATLTLENFKMDVQGDANTECIILPASKNVTVLVKGSNSIQSTGLGIIDGGNTNGDSHELLFKGEAGSKLTLHAQSSALRANRNTTIQDLDLDVTNVLGCAIFLVKDSKDYNLTFKNADVDVTVNTDNRGMNGGAIRRGNQAAGSIIVEDSDLNVLLQGDKVNSNALDSSGDLVIRRSKVVSQVFGPKAGLIAAGNVVIDDCEITSTASGPAIYGIKGCEINDSNVDAQSGHTYTIGIQGTLQMKGDSVISSTNTNEKGGYAVVAKEGIRLSDTAKLSTDAESGKVVGYFSGSTDDSFTMSETATLVFPENMIDTFGTFLKDKNVPARENLYVGEQRMFWNGEQFLSDYTRVKEAIEKAESLNKDQYKEFTAVEQAINAVVEGLALSEQETVDGYAAAIEAAIAGLEYKDADYTKVDAAIAKANALNKDEYKDFSAVEAAVSAVIRGKNITEQATVDGYATAMESAISALEYKDADYSKVDAAIAKANALNKDEYKNFSAVEAAVSAVVRGKNITEQEIVNGYATAIENAIKALEKKSETKPTDPTQPTQPTKPTQPTPNKPPVSGPKTGDDTQIGVWITLVCVSVLGTAALVVARKRYGKSEER